MAAAYFSTFRDGHAADAGVVLDARWLFRKVTTCSTAAERRLLVVQLDVVVSLDPRVNGFLMVRQ